MSKRRGLGLSVRPVTISRHTAWTQQVIKLTSIRDEDLEPSLLIVMQHRIPRWHSVITLTNLRKDRALLAKNKGAIAKCFPPSASRNGLFTPRHAVWCNSVEIERTRQSPQNATSNHLLPLA